MSQLKSLKNRISSIHKIGKITSTMKMVSVSRLRKVLDKKEKAEDYQRGSNELLANSIMDWDVNLLPEIVKGRKEKTRLILVVSPNRGLCGELNAWVLRVLKRRMKSLKEQGINFKIFPVGKKAISFCKHNFPRLIDSREELSMSAAESVFNRIVHRFEKGQIDRVEAIYPSFVSTLSQKVLLTPLLPIYDHKEFANLHLRPTCAIRDPSADAVLNVALSIYIKGSIVNMFAQAISSETAARMVSMDRASRKCSELSDSLVLKYNRDRQGAITNELLEVISGVEAMSE